MYSIELSKLKQNCVSKKKETLFLPCESRRFVNIAIKVIDFCIEIDSCVSIAESSRKNNATTSYSCSIEEALHL